MGTRRTDLEQSRSSEFESSERTLLLAGTLNNLLPRHSSVLNGIKNQLVEISSVVVDEERDWPVVANRRIVVWDSVAALRPVDGHLTSERLTT